MIGRLAKHRDWWDSVAELISAEVFDRKMTPEQLEKCAQLLRELVEIEQDILGVSS